MCDEDVVTATRGSFDFDVWRTTQQFGNLRFNTVDRVNLTRLQSSSTGSCIVQDDQLNIIVVAHFVSGPVVRVLCERHAHTRFISLKRVKACADCCCWIVKSAIWLNDQVVVRHQVWKVSVTNREGQFKHIAICAHRFDAFHDTKCT